MLTAFEIRIKAFCIQTADSVAKRSKAEWTVLRSKLQGLAHADLPSTLSDLTDFGFKVRLVSKGADIGKEDGTKVIDALKVPRPPY